MRNATPAHAVTRAVLMAAIRATSGSHVVELHLTPGWCLAGVHVRRTPRCRNPDFFIGRGARTEAAALRKLLDALRERPDYRRGRAIRKASK